MGESKNVDETARRGPSRRTVLKLAGGAAGCAAFVHALSPVAAFIDGLSWDEFVQKHYQELSEADKAEIFRRLEAQTLADHGAEVRISDPPPLPDTKYAYGLNLSLCVGCRKCAQACHRENNHDRATNNSYIRVFEDEGGNLDLGKGTANYTHAVPRENHSYMPVQCHQCDKPPCVDVCPTRATWKEADGLVVIDYNWCIGCRYCQAACPYHARRFNWTKPEIPTDEINPDQAYLSNRIRPQGAMEKCTFCLHRVRRGRAPACLETCPSGARVFGNILDPHSDVRWVLANKRVLILKEDYGTVPSFFYFFSE